MKNETINQKDRGKQADTNWRATRTVPPRQGPLYENGEKRPPAGENLVDGGVGPDDGGGATGVGTSVHKPSLKHKQAGSGGLTGGAERDDAEGEEPPPRPAHEAVFEFLKANWMLVVGIAVVLFVVVFFIKALDGGAPSDQSMDGRIQSETPPLANGAQAPQSATSTNDTGVAFDAPTEQDGDYYIRAGELAWKGKKEATEQGEKITLEGATAAQFTRAVALPGGSITTGVIGRAEPEGQILHATYQQVNLAGDQKTSGTYYTVEGGLITSRGDYEDERDEETITRTYDETRYQQGGEPEKVTYKVTFDAPPETPIPVLVGHEDPPTGRDRRSLE